MSIFDTKKMIEMVEVDQSPTDFILRLFFPTPEVFDTKFVVFDLEKQGRKTAAYVSPQGEGVNYSLVGYDEFQYRPPNLKVKKTITVDDLLKKLPGEIQWSDGNTATQRAAAKLLKEYASLDDIITRAEELQGSEAINDGIVVAKDINNKTVATINYGRDAGQTVTASPLWDSGTGEILEDLRLWRRQTHTLSGVTPNKAIFGWKAIDVFLANDEVKAYFDNRRFPENKIAMEMAEEGVTFVGNFEGMDIYGYNGTYLDQTGTSQNYMDPEKLVMGSSDTNARLYGALDWMEDDSPEIFAMSRLPVSWVQKNISSRILQVMSSPLVVTKNPDVFLQATVTAAP